MREIREYNMNGTIILGVDNGYGNVKTAHRVFPTGIIKCDSEPVLSKEYIEYDGAYYIIGEGHKGFVADKQEDDDTYILTLAAIAKELEARGFTEARIHLAVGLPLKWVQAPSPVIPTRIKETAVASYTCPPTPADYQVPFALLPQ